MSVNKYKPHVLLIPEDRANEQLANGFRGHYAIDERAANVRAPAGGWRVVLDVFETEYLQYLRAYSQAFVVLMIDFDEDIEARRFLCDDRIPDDVKSRVFVLGSKDKPETLKRELALSFEAIGEELAQDCLKDDLGRWGHPHLSHNRAELQRLVALVKPFLFQTS